MNKTYLIITYNLNGRQESESFIRNGNLPTPTDLGAARMVSKKINLKFPGFDVKSNDICVERIEEMVYTT